MRRLRAAIALSMLCSLAACDHDRIASALRPDLDHPDRLVCEGVPASRPAIPAEYVIDWSAVTTVLQAKAQHEAYVRSVRSREGVVASYVVTVEGRLFVCSSNAQWWRDYWAGLPDPE